MTTQPSQFRDELTIDLGTEKVDIVTPAAVGINTADVRAQQDAERQWLDDAMKLGEVRHRVGEALPITDLREMATKLFTASDVPENPTAEWLLDELKAMVIVQERDRTTETLRQVPTTSRLEALRRTRARKSRSPRRMLG
ncbi:hypothetical protein COY07_03340 [Candidatus Peregrinibacteria bacterium CG_4_10_14_0_2_um_filter_43_11]|nr:MAG: hypothetical protein COY07_03340 [Candidatus Peregrinibacteria bacterium CG_4_10_14_0_2_um_filter_43_11]